MKKAIYLFAAAAFMASCNQEVLVDNATNAQPEVNRRIGFDTFVDKATRTESTTTDNNSTALNDFYPTFYVYGWKTVGTETTCVFNNIPVEFFATDTQGKVVYKEEGQKPGDEWNFAADSWYYENVRYWDKMASSYQFSAYTPAAEDVVTCTSAGIITIGSESKPVTVDDTNLLEDAPSTDLAFIGFDKDYMTATSTDANGTVALTFKHLQAKMNVRIKLHDNMKTAQEVKVTEIKIHNLNDKGYYTNATETITEKDGDDKTIEKEVPVGVTGWTTGTATADYVLSVTNDYLISPVEVEEEEKVEEVAEVEEGENQEEEESTETDDTEGETEDEEAEEVKVSYHNHYVLEQLLIPQTISKPANSAPQLNLYNEACIYVEYTIGAETFRSYSPLADIFIGEGAATTYTFEGGKQYTINVIVGPSPIEFTATVDDWETKEEADQDMD